MFERYDYERLRELEKRAENGTIDDQMRPYLKWLSNRAEQLQNDRDRLKNDQVKLFRKNSKPLQAKCEPAKS